MLVGGHTTDLGSGGGGTVRSILNGRAGVVGVRAAVAEVGVSPSDGGLPQIAVPLSIGGCWLGTVGELCDQTPKSASDDVPNLFAADKWRRTSESGSDGVLSIGVLAVVPHILAVLPSQEDGCTKPEAPDSIYWALGSLGTDILRASFQGVGPFSWSFSRAVPIGSSLEGRVERQISVPSLGTSVDRLFPTIGTGSENFLTAVALSHAVSCRTGI